MEGGPRADDDGADMECGKRDGVTHPGMGKRKPSASPYGYQERYEPDVDDGYRRFREITGIDKERRVTAPGSK